MSESTAPPPRARQRREPFFDHLLYTRRPGKGRLIQLRWWVSRGSDGFGGGSVNLGLFDPEFVPIVRRKLISATRDAPATAIGLWRALQGILDEYRARGIDVPTVWPKYVYKCKTGDGFGARVRVGTVPNRRLIELAGPFATPEEAHERMVAHLRVTFPKWNRLQGQREPGTRRPGCPHETSAA